MNYRSFGLLLSLLSFTVVANANDPELVIESTLRPLSPLITDKSAGIERISVVPKQPVRLDIKLGSDRWFTAPPHMPLWDMPGAVVVDSK
nr:hypothetical protein [Endozoicomonas sp.]